MGAETLSRTGRRKADTYAQRYGTALHAADAAGAEQVVDEALAARLAPSAIQSLVIMPALTGIGESWEANRIDVADEHVATAITHSVLVKLFDRLRVEDSRRRERILLAAVEGQHHVLGLRMIADVLEGAGFDVLYLGADVPVGALSRFAAEHDPAITGLAYGVNNGIGALAESILAVHEACPKTQIMLGGRAVPQGLVDAGYPRVTDSMEVLPIVEGLLRDPSRGAPADLERLRRSHREPRAPDAGPEPLAERLAAIAEGSTETAREYVRSAGAFKDLAYRDPVSGLANRRAFDDRMHTRVHAEADGPGGALLMIDVDRFKAVNDTFGHETGDVVLRRVGTSISRTIRDHDFAARIGGDEFAVVLPESSLDEAREVGARITRAIAEDTDPPVTVSIGLAPLSADVRMAMLDADGALYAAKGAGRDCVVDATRRAGAPPDRAAPPADLYVSMSRLEVEPDSAPDLVAAFRNRARLADRADGFIDLQVWQSDRDASEILMISRWRDRDAFKAYMKSPEHRASHDRIDADLKADIALRRLEHLHTYRVVAE